MDAVSTHSRRRFLGCAGGALLGAGVASTSASAETTTEITIIHDSYFNGLYNSAEDPDNIATYFGLVNALRERALNPLVLGKGNDLSPSVMTTLFDGAHVIDERIPEEKVLKIHPNPRIDPPQTAWECFMQ
ncbi:hypothetical protein [Saliphagus infecundisoli]|uniref:Uncharacterized protein n=1 Tax=Saliphagus infecundisoli TaxID=1849069 RepID=A0ABD5QIE9_9EURY|nr:hypothetical protein [Saliphagus infecundisoli]